MSAQNAIVIGSIHHVGEVQSFGKGFRKQTVVVEVVPERGWPAYIPVDITGDDAGALAESEIGHRIKIEVRLGGRKWQKSDADEPRYFASLEAVQWRVSDPAPVPVDPVPAPAALVDDDIPF